MQRRLTRALEVGVTTCALVLTSSHATRAQTPSEIAVAKQWFSDGLAREEKGEFGPALDLFRRAAQVKRTPQIVYHVGFCESRTGALVEALVDLDGAAGLARAAHADDVVAAAQSELAEVKKRVPTLQVRAPSGANVAKLLVDGSSIALSLLGTAMPLDPGDHGVSIELQSGGIATQRITLVEHDAKVLDFVAPSSAPPSTATPIPPAPAPGPASAPALVAPATPPPPSADRSSTPEWVVVGVGAALAIGGASLFGVARAKEGSLNAACPSHTQCDPSLESTYNTATTLNSVGVGLGAVGIAAAGVGLSLLVLHPSRSSSTSAAVVLSPRGVAFTTEF